MEESPAEREDEQVEADEEREVKITRVTAITGRGLKRAWYPEITVVSWWCHSETLSVLIPHAK